MNTQFRWSLLAVDDEPSILRMLQALLGVEYDVEIAESAEDALERLKTRAFDVILTDQQLPGLSGVQLLEWARNQCPHSVRILMTGVARVEDAADAINCGQVHRYLFKPWRPEQLVQMLQSATREMNLQRSHDHLYRELQRLNAELEQRVRERTAELEEANRQLQQKNQLLERMALTDPLTGLPNRRAMDRLARQELLRRARHPQPLAIGLIDADHFKEINTEFLLPGGDHALIWLGQRLLKAVRATDTIGRIGGEEFMVVAPHTDLPGAINLAERARQAVESGATEYDGREMRLTVSVGMVVLDGTDPVALDSVKHAAASALAEAKRTGRNRCVVRRL